MFICLYAVHLNNLCIQFIELSDRRICVKRVSKQIPKFLGSIAQAVCLAKNLKIMATTKDFFEMTIARMEQETLLKLAIHLASKGGDRLGTHAELLGTMITQPVQYGPVFMTEGIITPLGSTRPLDKTYEFDRLTANLEMLGKLKAIDLKRGDRVRVHITGGYQVKVSEEVLNALKTLSSSGHPALAGKVYDWETRHRLEETGHHCDVYVKVITEDLSGKPEFQSKYLAALVTLDRAGFLKMEIYEPKPVEPKPVKPKLSWREWLNSWFS